MKLLQCNISYNSLYCHSNGFMILNLQKKKTSIFIVDW